MSNEYIVYGENLPDAYHKALETLHRYGSIEQCSDWSTTQKEVAMTMVVENPLQEPMISKLFIGGPRELEQYRQEMLDGILDFEIAKGNWTYTYHDRMVNYPIDKWEVIDGEEEYVQSIDQIGFVINELKRNPSSRRAVIVIRDVYTDAYSEDPACLQYLQYFIRDNKLHCKVLFRSNDACKATYMNAFALIMLQKRIADELGYEVGTYTHRANSFHAYEQDFGLLEGYVNRIESTWQTPSDDAMYEVAADYEGDWIEMMEEYQPEIARLVSTLKGGVVVAQ